MNPPLPAAPSSRSRWGRLLLWFAALMTVSAMIVGVAVFNMISLARDGAVLKESLLAGMPGHPRTQVQLSAGPATLNLVRLGLGYIDDVPEEARLVLRAVRTASVGVYSLTDAPAGAARMRLLALADERMNSRGWSRIVAVNGRHEIVMVFTPAKAAGARLQKFCLAVCNRDQLVIVSGAADLNAVLKLVEHQEKFASR